MSRDHRLFEKVSRASPAELEAFFLRLRREKDFLERVINTLREGVIVTTPDLRILSLNRRSHELLKLAVDRQVAGLRLPDIVPYAEFRRLLMRIDEETAGVQEEIQVGSPGDKGPVSLAVAIAPLASERSQHAGFVVTIQDTSAQQLLAQEKRHAEKLASMATLTAGIAHEIKNPLNSMGIHAQLLEKLLDRAETADGMISVDTVRDSLGVVSEEIQRLNTMVNEFLQAVRPTVPWMEPKPLNEMLQRVAELAAPECERNGVELRVLPDPEVGLVQFDERQLSRAVLNLLNNAYDAVVERRERWREEQKASAAANSERGESTTIDDEEPPASVALRSRLRDDHAIIEVADTGGGIPPDVVARIFEPYFTTKFHGTGLGLMNVLRIVEEHGGKVLVDTNEGEGTRFTLVIPVRAPLPVRRIEERKPTASDSA